MTGTMFTDENGVRVYQMLVIRKGLEACQKGLRLNRAYTPSNLARAAGLITGGKYSRGKKGIQQAIDDLTKIINAREAKGELVEVGVDISA